MTTAEQIAELMGNDSSLFDNGRYVLHRLCVERGPAKLEFLYPEHGPQRRRYLFPDGSAIVALPFCWDIEGNEPFKMAGE